MRGRHSFELMTRAMLDYDRGKDVVFYIERDDGRRDERTAEDYFADYEGLPVHHREVLEFARGRVLDLGCGAGRHSLYLQEKGLQVTGVDISPIAVEVARKRGLKDARVAPIQELPFDEGAFDTILMLGNNFGLAGGPDETVALLRRLHVLTTAQGRLLVESVVPGGKEEHMAYVRQNIRSGRPPGLLRLRIEYQGEVGDWFDLLIVAPQDMAALGMQSGWTLRVGFYAEGREPFYTAVLEKADGSEPTEGAHWEQKALGEGW
jgi:SAM-dependent methyltransferase